MKRKNSLIITLVLLHKSIFVFTNKLQLRQLDKTPAHGLTDAFDSRSKKGFFVFVTTLSKMALRVMQPLV
jgi:hypothetical protein